MGMRSALLRLAPLVLLLACDQAAPPVQAAALTAAPYSGAAPQGTHGGALVYVPIYSSGQTVHDLTVMLSARNTDLTRPIVITRASFLDGAGKELHGYATAPVVVGPLASAEALIAESDTRAGVGGSFVVDWGAHEPVPDPVIDAVMIGSGNGQFVSEGHVVRRLPGGLASP